MSDRTDRLISLVQPFGVSKDETLIFLLLTERGALSALAISRLVRMGRTKVYRLLDKLKDKGLVVQRHDQYGFKFEAASPRKLEQLVTVREKEVESLKAHLPQLVQELTSLGGDGGGGSKVLYYEGLKGLQQITYNSLQAKDELRIYELSNMEAFFETNEAEEFRRELVANKILVRQLTNLSRYEEYTQVTELVRDFWQLRHVAPQKLKFRFEVLLYNDVYALYTYRGKEVFGVEIYSDLLAGMQRDMFEFVWKQSKPMIVLNWQGAAVVG